MCEPCGTQSDHGARGYDCCCCGGGRFIRHFMSTKEGQEKLEKYQEQLKKELAGVEERIHELQGK